MVVLVRDKAAVRIGELGAQAGCIVLVGCKHVVDVLGLGQASERIIGVADGAGVVRDFNELTVNIVEVGNFIVCRQIRFRRCRGQAVNKIDPATVTAGKTLAVLDILPLQGTTSAANRIGLGLPTYLAADLVL